MKWYTSILTLIFMICLAHNSFGYNYTMKNTGSPYCTLNTDTPSAIFGWLNYTGTKSETFEIITTNETEETAFNLAEELSDWYINYVVKEKTFSYEPAMVQVASEELKEHQLYYGKCITFDLYYNINSIVGCYKKTDMLPTTSQIKTLIDQSTIRCYLGI